MAQESNVDIKVRLGVLAHANVGQPGRRLVWHRVGGWVAVPARRSGLAGRLSHASVRPVLGVLGMAALVVPAMVWGLLHPDTPARPSALAQASVPVPAASEPANAQVPSPDVGRLGAAGAGEPVLPAASSPVRGDPSPLPGARMAPRPEWAAAPGATPAGMSVAPGHVFPAPDTGVTRAPRRPTGPPASRPASEVHRVSANPEARSARPTRRTGRGPADLAGPAAPASQAPPNDGVIPGPNPSDVLVAITGANSVVVPDKTGLPASFRVGERLPSGARLLRVDPRNGEAETDRGLIRLE